MKRVLLILLVAVAGCAGQIEITKPDTIRVENSKVVNKPREMAWDAAILALRKNFFVIDSLDRSSGLVNLSYTGGDPEKYLDCGQVSSRVKDADVVRTYRFPGASASQDYQFMNSQGALFNVNRTLSLDAAIKLILEDIGRGQTRVTVSTHYVVRRQGRVQQVRGPQAFNYADVISFDTGERASFPRSVSGQGTECIANGNLERAVLSVIN